jgi:hypothetical protein
VNISLSYSLLQTPLPLNIKYKNNLTIKAKEDSIINEIFNKQLAYDIDNQQSLDNFLSKQDTLRGIKSIDFLS